MLRHPGARPGEGHARLVQRNVANLLERPSLCGRERRLRSLREYGKRVGVSARQADLLGWLRGVLRRLVLQSRLTGVRRTEGVGGLYEQIQDPFHRLGAVFGRWTEIHPPSISTHAILRRRRAHGGARQSRLTVLPSASAGSVTV